MWLYLLRHGIAQERRSGLSDADRSLTAQGSDKTRRAALGLAWLLAKQPQTRPQVILASPKLRAMQTAKLVGQVLEVKVEALADLSNAPAPKLAKRLTQLSHASVMVVGHEPTLTQVMALLMTGHLIPESVELKKCGCACLELASPAHRSSSESAGLARLHWLLPPKVLRRLG